MARRTVLNLMCLLSLISGGCGIQKLTPEQLIVELQSHGYEVRRGDRIHHTVRGATEAFWISIDGVKVSAWRFDRRASAGFCATSMASGLCSGYWAFEYADSATVQKIKQALE